MMPWNRKEVFITNSLEELAKVRSKLAAAKIGYDYESPYGPFSGANRGHAGQMAGQDPTMTTTYRVFVANKDYDKAMELLRQY